MKVACLLCDTISNPAWGKATHRKENVRSLAQNEMAVIEQISPLTNFSWLEKGSQIQKRTYQGMTVALHYENV